MGNLAHTESESNLSISNVHPDYGATNVRRRETLGTIGTHTNSTALHSVSSDVKYTGSNQVLFEYEEEEQQDF